MYKSKHKSGFTLVELSIVLVIVGLLVGGVLQGQEIIKQAKIQKINRQITEYITTIRLFEYKYNALPGDMRNATTMIGGYANGNGDRIINLNSEEPLVWNHLSASKMLAAQYNGIFGSQGWCERGVNAPEIADGGCASFVYHGPYYGNYTGLHFMVGKSNGNHVSNGVLDAEEMYALDAKFDDGIANKGVVWAVVGLDWAGASAGCLNANMDSSTGASYNLTSTAKDCRFMYQYKN